MPCSAHLTLAELLDHFLTHEEYTSIAAPVNAGKPLEEYPQRETLKLKGVPYTHGYSVDAAKRAMTEARQMGRAVRHSPRAQPSSSGNTHPRTSAPHVPAPGRTSRWHAHPPWVFLVVYQTTLFACTNGEGGQCPSGFALSTSICLIASGGAHAAQGGCGSGPGAFQVEVCQHSAQCLFDLLRCWIGLFRVGASPLWVGLLRGLP